MKPHLICALVTLCLCSAAPSANATTYTYPQLVKQMIDLEALAELPPVGETTALASSYDRRSRYDAAHDKYIAWGANRDEGGIVGREGDSSILADIQGPGCLRKMWSAVALDGHVKIYLDGLATPAVDLPFKQYFDGTAAPFTRPNLVYCVTPKAAGHCGFNNYTPIPFQKSCRIVADKGWGSFFQFVYTRFPAGTMVPTFKMTLPEADAAALDQADHVLGQCGQNPVANRPGQIAEKGRLTVSPGENKAMADLSGPAAITGLKVKLALPKEADAQRVLLRQLTLSIRWNQEQAPAVWAPLGDFFGSVGGSKPHRSLPLGMMEDGTLYCYWYMPFEKAARIEIGNDGSVPVSLDWEVSHAPLDPPSAELGLFHAKWHRTEFPPRADRQPDWTSLKSEGRGRYVGTQLHVFQLGRPWWGEGDDKFFVDGEMFPSSFGTGSEDYFGFAWCSNKLFFKPNMGQALCSARHTSDYRYHIPDSVPFQRSFEGVIEKYICDNSTDNSTDSPANSLCQYAATVYWYLAPGGLDPYQPKPLADRIDYWLHPTVDPNFIEGEDLRGKGSLVQGMISMWEANVVTPTPVSFSGGYASMWNANREGDRVDLTLKVAQAGKYRFWIRCVKRSNGGTFHFALNGVNLGQPIDFYAPQLTAPEPIDMGTADLSAGEQKLTLTFDKKAATNSGKQSTGGIDFIRWAPVPSR